MVKEYAGNAYVMEVIPTVVSVNADGAVRTIDNGKSIDALVRAIELRLEDK